MISVGRTKQVVGGMHVSMNNVSRASTSVELVVHILVSAKTIRFTTIRGRPDNGDQPDGRSGELARRLGGTTKLFGVEVVSRIVVAGNKCCDFNSRKLV